MTDKEKEKDKRLQKLYGITLEEYKIKLKEQGNICCVCKKQQPRLCVDHIHVKGFKNMPSEEKRKYIRGICCFMCNTGFKSFEKTVDGKRNREQLEGTYKYFKKFKLKGE